MNDPRVKFAEIYDSFWLVVLSFENQCLGFVRPEGLVWTGTNGFPCQLNILQVQGDLPEVVSWLLDQRDKNIL